jgi:predicted ester cyclase
MFATAFTDNEFLVEELVAEGDMVCVRGTWSALHHAELNGIPATGERVTLGFMIMNRFANGKIVENWEQADMLGLMQQLGVIPAPQTE